MDSEEQYLRAQFNRRMYGRGAQDRTEPCPTCKQLNKLTKWAARQGYQCDECADKAERGVPGY
jgi:hypothetical protein